MQRFSLDWCLLFIWDSHIQEVPSQLGTLFQLNFYSESRGHSSGADLWTPVREAVAKLYLRSMSTLTLVVPCYTWLDMILDIWVHANMQGLTKCHTFFISKYLCMIYTEGVSFRLIDKPYGGCSLSSMVPLSWLLLLLLISSSLLFFFNLFLYSCGDWSFDTSWWGLLRLSRYIICEIRRSLFSISSCHPTQPNP